MNTLIVDVEGEQYSVLLSNMSANNSNRLYYSVASSDSLFNRALCDDNPHVWSLNLKVSLVMIWLCSHKYGSWDQTFISVSFKLLQEGWIKTHVAFSLLVKTWIGRRMHTMNSTSSLGVPELKWSILISHDIIKGWFWLTILLIFNFWQRVYNLAWKMAIKFQCSTLAVLVDSFFLLYAYTCCLLHNYASLRKMFTKPYTWYISLSLKSWWNKLD